MKPRLAATVVLPAYGVQDAIASVVRDLAVAAYALRARGIELDVLLLECVTGHESRVCVTHLSDNGLLAEFNCHS
jgi:hypothetical protein